MGVVRSSTGSRWVLPQYVALAVTWGASFLFVELALTGLSPVQVVLARLVVGAATLAAVTVLTRQRLPREPVVWGHLAVTAVLLCVAPFLLFAWAQQSISSGLASIYNATTPLMTALVALAALREERPTTARVTGLALGFAGVLVVLAPWRGVDGGSGPAQAACLLATVSYGCAFVYLRRFVAGRGIPAVPVATVQVGLAAALLLPAAGLVASSPVSLDTGVVLGVLGLGALSTGLAYVWNTNVVAGWGATDAASVTYLTPVVGVVLGVLVLGESIGGHQVAGAAVVVLGVVVSHGRVRYPAARPRALISSAGRSARRSTRRAGHPRR